MYQLLTNPRNMEKKAQIFKTRKQKGKQQIEEKNVSLSTANTFNNVDKSLWRSCYI